MTDPNPFKHHTPAGVARPLATSALDRLAREGVAHDVLWHEGGRQFAQRLLARLRDERKPGVSDEDALAAAVAAAYATSTAPVGQREGWAACALSAATRDILRASLESERAEQLADTAGVAESIARAARARMGDGVLSGARDGVANAARRAMAELHEAALGTDGVPAVTAAIFGHLRHGCSQLRTGAAIDAIARGAVTRADRAEHGDSHSAWTRAEPSVRRAVVSASLAEAAVALARTASREWSRAPEVSVGLARCAFGLLGAAGEAGPWLLGPIDHATAVSDDEDTAHERAREALARAATTATTALEASAQRTAQQARAAGGAPANRRINTEATMSNGTNNGGTNGANNGTTSGAARVGGQVLATLEHDAQDAAWRLAGTQFVKLMRDPLVGLLSRHLAPGDDAMRGRIASFLETELGAALLSAMLSAALSSLPRGVGPVPDRLARELRVRAMTDAGDVVADLVMGPMRQVMALYLQDPGFHSAMASATPSLEAPRDAHSAHVAHEPATSSTMG